MPQVAVLRDLCRSVGRKTQVSAYRDLWHRYAARRNMSRPAPAETMHELSIAQSLVSLIEEQVPDPADRVAGVTLRVGTLSGVVPAALRSAFHVAAADTVARGATLTIESVAVAAWCEACRAEREVPGPLRLVCPQCGARMPRIVRGRELELVSIEVQLVTDDSLAGPDDAHRAGSPEGAEAE